MGLGIPKLVSPDHWGYTPQARGHRQLPCVYDLRVGSPTPVVKVGADYLAAVSSERQSQLSLGQQRIGLAQHGPLISSHMVPKTPPPSDVGHKPQH